MSKVILYEKEIDGINIKYSVSKAEPCLLNALIINDVPSSIFTFGKVKDISSALAPPNYFGCMNRKFIPYALIPPKDLEELKIKKEDVQKINDFISSIANRGKCNFCEKRYTKS